MRINVQDILAQDLGFSRSYAISDERPDLDQVTLTAPINGEVTLTKLEDGIVAAGRASTELELECHRCLRTFTRPMTVRFSETYSETPDGDQLPIEDDQINLGELIQQELLVNLPIKILHAPDCAGVEGASPDIIASGEATLGARARIKKEGND